MEAKNQEMYLSLSPEEMMEVNGGEVTDLFKKYLKKLGILGIAYELYEHWDEFEEGFVSGWKYVVKP